MYVGENYDEGLAGRRKKKSFFKRMLNPVSAFKELNPLNKRGIVGKLAPHALLMKKKKKGGSNGGAVKIQGGRGASSLQHLYSAGANAPMSITAAQASDQNNITPSYSSGIPYTQGSAVVPYDASGSREFAPVDSEEPEGAPAPAGVFGLSPKLVMGLAAVGALAFWFLKKGK